MNTMPDQTDTPATPEDRSSPHLRQWLAERIGMRMLLATGPAPIWSADEPGDDLQARLEQLDAAVSIDALSYAPALRYSAMPEPLVLRLTRRHEGMAPPCPAVLCPASSDELPGLIALAERHGFPVALEEDGAHPAGSIAVSFHRMNTVEIADDASGLVRFGRGAGWDDLRAALGDQATQTTPSRSWGVPRDIETVFATPAEAAAAGLFAARPRALVRGVPTGFDMVLPPAGSVILQGTWLFDSRKKAVEAFAEACRREPPFYAELIDDIALHLGDKTGRWRLPRQVPPIDAPRTGLRVVHLGTPLANRIARFRISWPIEMRSGRFWRNGPLISETERLGILLDSGIGFAGISVDGALADDGDTAACPAEKLREAAKAWQEKWPEGPQVTPLLTSESVFCNGRTQHRAGVLFPRDFVDPVGQWRAVTGTPARAGDARTTPADVPPRDTAPGEGPSDDGKETQGKTDDTEWHAIREALMPAGEVRPPRRLA